MRWRLSVLACLLPVVAFAQGASAPYLSTSGGTIAGSLFVAGYLIPTTRVTAAGGDNPVVFMGQGAGSSVPASVGPEGYTNFDVYLGWRAGEADNYQTAENTGVGYGAQRAGNWISASNGATGNTSLGAYTLYSNQLGQGTTCIGNYSCQNSALSATFTNTAGGVYSLRNGNGNVSVALGYGALRGNDADQTTTALKNTVAGYLAVNAPAITTAHDLVVIGNQAMPAVTSASFNVAIGSGAGAAATTVSSSVLIGQNAGASQTNQNSHTIVGHLAYPLSTGSTQTGFGYNTAASVTSGARVVAFGDSAGSTVLTTGGTGIILGVNGVTASTAGGSNFLRVGNGSNIVMSATSTNTATPTVTFSGQLSVTGKVIGNKWQLGATNLTLTTGAFGMDKSIGVNVAAGAGGGALRVVCGTGAGTAKLVALAGTSTTGVTLVDNVGAGVTGC